MKVFNSLPQKGLPPLALTIGTFDGVHLGHQHLLQRLRSYKVPTALLTFPDHPLRTLQPAKAPRLLTPPELKLHLLAQYHIDFVFLLPFTPSFATTPFDTLLHTLLPLSHLVFGKGALFGRNREGDESKVRKWCETRSIHAEYIDTTQVKASSRTIRQAVETGHLEEAEQMLGRKHLLYAPTQEFGVEHLSLPPDGTYRLSENTHLRLKKGRAHLSHPIQTPTIFSILNLEAPHA